MSGIVVDASAIIAMLENEPDAPRLREVFLAATPRWIAAMGVLECSVVLTSRRGLLARAGLDAFLDRFKVQVLPFDPAQVRTAQDAYERFGKGRHKAALNLGDCCAYAAARALGLPLLQKGDDFPATDLEVVPW